MGVSLLSDIEANLQTPGSRCTVTAVLEELNDTDRADLEAALENTRYPNSAIAKALSLRGERIGANTIGRHRRRDCKCP